MQYEKSDNAIRLIHITIKIFILSVFIFIHTEYCIFAEWTVLSREEADAKLAEELKWLHAEAIDITDIATKIGMDADLVPGMVTVLNGEELERRGIRTVAEAMQLIPGMETSADPIVRGIGKSFSSGKIKMLLNSTPLNATMDGGVIPIYYIPVEQIERIEFIRGPGSALYGNWAYLGVMNVVTRESGNRVFGRYGSFDARYGGGIFSSTAFEGDFKGSLNIAAWERDSAGVEAGPDSLYGTDNEGVSQAPGPVNDSRQNTSAFLKLDYKEISFLTQYISYDVGTRFGMADALPPPNDQRIEFNEHYVSEIRWHPEISAILKLNFNLGWKQYLFDRDDAYLYPPGFAIYEDGLIVGPHYEERGMFGSMDILWKGWNRHTLLLGMEYDQSNMTDVWVDANYHPVTGEPFPSVRRLTGDDNWLDEDNCRSIFSFFIQDQFDISDRFSLTTGLRYDYYDDTDDRLTPRIAGVFQASEKHIFKAQYAEAFRPPAFIEMYAMNNPILNGSSDTAPETVRTWELEYIYKNPRAVGRITLFFSQLEDLIVYEKGKYANSTEGIETRGAEVELKWNILPSLVADANLSYSDTKDKNTDTAVDGSSEWLGNIGFMYQPVKDYVLSLRFRHVGKRNRPESDPRPSLSGYDTVNFSAGVENLLRDGLTLRAGVKNLFDEDVRVPSSYPGYIDDYPMPGREWWIQVSYTF